MKFILEISTDNAAFDIDPGVEVARILRETADRLDRMGYTGHDKEGGRLRDANGNFVGGFEFSDDPPCCGF